MSYIILIVMLAVVYYTYKNSKETVPQQTQSINTDNVEVSYPYTDDEKELETLVKIAKEHIYKLIERDATINSDELALYRCKKELQKEDECQLQYVINRTRNEYDSYVHQYVYLKMKLNKEKCMNKYMVGKVNSTYGLETEVQELFEKAVNICRYLYILEQK